MIARKRTVALLAVFGMGIAVVKANAEAPKISGFVDTSYNYDFNKPASRLTQNRSFDRKTDTFLMNSAQVNIEGSKEGIGYYAELAYGTDASIYKAAGTGNDGGINAGTPSNVAYNFELQEAYLTYKCSKTHIQLKAGKFATTEGIEVIESKDNATVSRGYMFGLAEPYTHVGAMAGYAFGSIADLWVGAVNGWDLHTDNNKSKTLIAKLGFTPIKMVSGSLSFLHGAEKSETLTTAPNGPNTDDIRRSVDLTVFVKPISKLNIGLQGNWGEEDHASIHRDRRNGAAHWYGVGVQPKYDICEKFAVGARYEWFSDLDGARTSTTQVMQNVAIAPTVNLTESLMFRVEYRYDWSTRLVYETSDGQTSKGETSSISTEFVYKF